MIESRQAATVVLMLNSPEEDVQSKACEAIYRFVDKCEFLISKYKTNEVSLVLKTKSSFKKVPLPHPNIYICA